MMMNRFVICFDHLNTTILVKGRIELTHLELLQSEI